eukprot:1150130-Pelagomonas_calceolata.AAC.4
MVISGAKVETNYMCTVKAHNGAIGMDGAGQVSQAGPDVSDLRSGDRVAYVSMRGGRCVWCTFLMILIQHSSSWYIARFQASKMKAREPTERTNEGLACCLPRACPPPPALHSLRGAYCLLKLGPCSYAEYVVVPAEHAIKIPDGMNAEMATAEKGKARKGKEKPVLA